MTDAYLAPYVPSPARVPVPYGLFSLSGLFREGGEGRWEGAGVRWQSFNGANDLGVIGKVQQPQSSTPGLPKSFSNSTIEDNAGVFTIYGQHKVTPGAGWTQEKSTERARAMLAALGERTVEKVLSGALGTLSPSFAGATNLGSPADMIAAISLLESHLASSYGSLGVIHMSRKDATVALARDNVLVVNGGRLFTKLGTPVVAGQGYVDTLAWCTSPLVAYRSEIFDSSGRGYDLLDRNTNDLYAIAEQTYSLGFESASLAAVTIASPAV